MLRILLDVLGDTLHIGIVQSIVHFVQNKEGSLPVLVECEQQRQRRYRLLSPRKLADVAELLSHRTHCVFHSTEVRFLGISTRTLLYVRVGEGKDSLASSGELNTASEVLVGSVDHCLHLLIGIHES